MKKAFTLIELMIVIIIMGVIYSFSVNKFHEIGKREIKLSLQNLKEYLLSYPHSNDIKLVCIDGCQSCFLTVDGQKATTNVEPFLDNSVKVYRYDFHLGALQRESKVYFNKEDVEEDVCFSYEIDKKGIGDQILVEYNDKVYDFTSYFASPLVYHTLTEAVDAKRHLAAEVDNDI